MERSSSSLSTRDRFAEVKQDMVNGNSARIADGVLVSVETGFSISCREDREQASDTLAILRRTSKSAKERLTEVFRPMKAFEKSFRDEVGVKIAAWDAGAAAVEAEMRRWDAAEERRRRDEAAAQQAAINESHVGGDGLLPAQVVVKPQANLVSGAVGKDHKMRTIEAVELVDAMQAAREWPHLLELSKQAAKAEYEALVKKGLADLPGEAGVVMGGIRFVTKTTYVSGRLS